MSGLILQVRELRKQQERHAVGTAQWTSIDENRNAVQSEIVEQLREEIFVIARRKSAQLPASHTLQIGDLVGMIVKEMLSRGFYSKSFDEAPRKDRYARLLNILGGKLKHMNVVDRVVRKYEGPLDDALDGSNNKVRVRRRKMTHLNEAEAAIAQATSSGLGTAFKLEHLREVLDRLSRRGEQQAKQCKAFWMKEIEGCSIGEVASALNVGEGQAYQLARSAKEFVKKELGSDQNLGDGSD